MPASAPPAPGQPAAGQRSSDPHQPPRAWVPGQKALLIAAAAFAVGLLLFLLVWLQARTPGDAKADIDASKNGEGSQFEPLPTPLPAGSDGNASGMDPDAEVPPARPRDISIAPPPPAPPAPEPAPAMPTPPLQVAAGNDSLPQPIYAPPPRYPRAAQRRGESGTVLLRAYVTADGSVDRIEILQSSQSRNLDRAASDAIRRWRFQPAIRAGQAVPGNVMVPITFNPGR